MQDMLRAEHGGMNEVLADVADMTGDLRYLALARRFSHQAVLQPLANGQDKLTGALPCYGMYATADGRHDAVVLLSPACASFDQYPNFEVRGDAFVQAVAKLPGIIMTNTGDDNAART